MALKRMEIFFKASEDEDEDEDASRGLGSPLILMLSRDGWKHL